MNISALYAAVLIPVAVLLDRYRRSVKITFNADGAVGRILEIQSSAFQRLAQSAAIWTVNAEGETRDWKRNAGATKLNRRSEIRLSLGKPDCIRSRVKFPAFRFGVDELYLLPDAALAVVSNEIAAVSYIELGVNGRPVRFIEEGRVPSDTTIVDQTWRYVNKSGGPDRRFLNNARLPICAYGELSLWSQGGLNCKLQFSDASAADSLQAVLAALRKTASDLPGPVSYLAISKRWPTVAFVAASLFLAALQAVFISVHYHRTANLSQRASSNSVESVQAPAQAKTIDPTSQSKINPPLELRPPERELVKQSPVAPTEALNVGDPQNARWTQLRLRELGFYRGAINAAIDAPTRQALRDFKASNNLDADEKWDLRTEQALKSTQAVPAERSFVGSWSETTCEPGSRPDITISSRRAVSAAGGVCEFSGLKATGGGWAVNASCTNAGDRWNATIHLSVQGRELIWVGRNGTPSRYSRCQAGAY